mmetsp:Transcript_70987/g.196026  ORF Transcript_70987/g.196026 Transcript_70987/m.196026 type:complete len:209 (-) Transcript_70987:1454-2080(-)
MGGPGLARAEPAPLQQGVWRWPDFPDALHAGASRSRRQLSRQLTQAAEGLQHAAVQRGVPDVGLVAVVNLLGRLWQGHHDPFTDAPKPWGEVQHWLRWCIGRGSALLGEGGNVPSDGLHMEPVERLVFLLHQLRRRRRTSDASTGGAAAERRRGLRGADEERGSALQRSAMWQGVHQRQVGRLARLGELHSQLRWWFPCTPQEHRAVP